ncbi:MAG: PRC-barrel domain-containing protein [Alphaproteobacteria bacterium]|nr:PRC-barrel domain-containing protein [Alphaproteobacteria bacterium]MCW5742537.1 PRC-barrel domain-containing protein [Alphaproteobacteria bacterium]
MLKPILIATALSTFGAASLYAQSAPPPASPAPPTQERVQDRATAPAFTADTRKLIGRNVKNAQGETIGEIEAIYLDKDGKVDSVIIGVGGFLGMGERNVRVSWHDLTIADNGERVTTAFTKDQLKAMPEYKYREAGYRGQVFTDRGVYREGTAPPPGAPRTTADRPTTVPGTAPPPGRTTADRTPPPGGAQIQPTKDFNADGHISADAIIGASVRNTANENIGDVNDVYVDKDGKIQMVVVSVGGFLGIGTKRVAVKWSDLQMRRDGNTLVLLSNWTKDSLKSMPDYTWDREEAERK